MSFCPNTPEMNETNIEWKPLKMRLLRSVHGLLPVALALTAAFLTTAAQQPRVLVYTKNQIGPGLFVHDNIPDSVAAIKKLGRENHFLVEVSDDPATFTEPNLQRFKVIVFDNSNNEIFDTEAQKAALQHFVRAGGGIVGLHSACGSMRHWPWFWSLMGGKFARHARLQPFTIKNKDPKNISTAHLPASFQWTDEFYYLDQMPDDLHVLLAGDLTTLDDPQKEKSRNPKYGQEVPLTWCHQFDGGREWFTALGHQKEHYADPQFARLILGGILWAMGETNVAH
jgi:type 1 glutamine amidotransferase